MAWSPFYWGITSQRENLKLENYISDAQMWRSDLAAERAHAERRAAAAKWYKSGNFDELSKLLDDAERFLANGTVARPAYRQMWERKLESARSWEGRNKHIHGQIRQLIRRVRDCQSEATQLRQLAERTRRELGL